MVADPFHRLTVFLDSSVLIAAAISPTGAGRALIHLGFTGACQLAISPLVFTETERNLTAKAPLALPAFELFRSVLAASVVTPSKAAVLRAEKFIVAKDAPIVAAAVRARALYLASYDRKDLLSQRAVIQEKFGIIAAAPDEVLAVVRQTMPEEGLEQG